MGVLTAGAAFMVLDPAYPAPRLVEMLRLAAPRAWIALEAAGPVPAAVRAWLEAAGCPCLELPAGGRRALESVAAVRRRRAGVAVGPQDVALHRLHLGLDRRAQGDPRPARVALALPADVLPRAFELWPGRPLLAALRALPRPAPAGHLHPALPGRGDRRAGSRRHRHRRPPGGVDEPRAGDGGEPDARARPAPHRAAAGRASWCRSPACARVVLVGEALTRRDVARLRAMAPGGDLHQPLRLDGDPARAGASTGSPGRRPRPSRSVPGRCCRWGAACEDVQLLVINRAGGLAGIGEIGEIAMRSPHLARGYLGNAALTAERFQVNPFTGRGRGPDLPHRRPRALPARRRGGVRRPLGLPGQAARLPHRAGGDRGGAGPPSRRCARRRCCCATDLPGGGGLVAYVVPHRRGRGAATAELHDCALAAPAGLHGAGGVRLPGRRCR